MRKLAPMFVMTSIVALAGGTAFANMNDTGTPDNKTGSPTVSKNTQNPQGLSYSDKSNTAKGTNARIDSNSSVAASSTAGGAVAAVDDDKTLLTNDRRNDDTTANKKITKKKHKKVASNGMKTSINPPVDATHAAAVNSTTGVSGGDSGSSAGSAGSAGSSGSSAK